MKRIRTTFLVWLLILVLGQPTSLQPAGAFSIGAEREMGEKLLYSVRSAFSLLDDPDITQYITSLGRNVLEVAGVQYFDYHFFVIDNKEFNAFAAPSGLIFFHSGLIATMHSEDELVSVLAHEIGHIVKRHLASRVEKGTYTSIASLGLALAAVAFGGSAAPALLTGALATGQSMNLHFSRQHEEEADLLAYGWMKKLGRNPEAQAEMLETMRRIARYRSDRLPQYLLTHPNPEARLNYIESLLDIDRQELPRLPPADSDFAFTRFKYRVMSETQEPRSFRAYLANIVADGKRDESAKIMARYGLALLAHTENNHDLALKELAPVLEEYPDENMLQVDKGVFLFSSGRIAEAEEILRNSLLDRNNNMYAAFTLAKLLYRTGRLDEAEEYFNRVRYELPEYAKVYFEIGQIAADRKEPGTASFYLGKFNLYEGKLPLADHHLQSALRSKDLPEKMRTEAEALRKKIAALQK